MTKKLIAILATLPVATLGAAGLAMADMVTVTNYNAAFVANSVTTVANSGGNTANGGTGGSAGAGGSVWGSDNDDNTTGNGGAAGNGGNGGSVTTGVAIATTDIRNDVNRNDTTVDLCGCEEDSNDVEDEEESDDVVVTNVNGAFLANGALTGADSGYNMTDGGSAGAGGNGGEVVGEDNDDNTTGTGGSAGAGGNGGIVSTGRADSLTSVVNWVNTNITHIRR